MDATCEVLMPWAAPIGSGQGPRNPRALGRPFIGSRNIPSFARDETIGAADRVN
jgi:thiazole synthase ThiGH ThiG subunit